MNILYKAFRFGMLNVQFSIFNIQFSIKKGETLRGQPLVNPDLSSKELEMAIVLILASGLLIVTNVYGHYCNAG